MVLYSNSDSQEQSFLPSIADNNGSKRKHKAKKGTKGKDLRQKKQKDVMVHFPELATKNSSKTFTRKSSSPKVTFQTQEMLKKRQKEATNSTSHEKRRRNLRLPSLALTSTSESVTSKPSTESWSAALGLRDTYEIPRGLLNKLTDEILKIDRQMREEAKIQRIRENRIISSEWGHSIMPKHSFSVGTFERTSRQGFSYFPSLQTRSVDQSSDSMSPHWAEDKMRERMIRQEAEIGRKLKEFKNRHSLLKYKE